MSNPRQQIKAQCGYRSRGRRKRDNLIRLDAVAATPSSARHGGACACCACATASDCWSGRTCL